MSNNRRAKKHLLASLVAASIFALGMAGCGGGGSTGSVDASPTNAPAATPATATVVGTVPGTFIEAFCDNGSYYSAASTQNGTSRHPFSLDLPADVGCHLVMTTNEGTSEEIVSSIGFLDSDNRLQTRMLFTANSFIDLGHIPLPMNHAEAAGSDINGDGILDAPFVLDNYRAMGANNPLLQSDADNDGINDWQDSDHGGYRYMVNTIDPQDVDGDGVVNRYDEDFTPAANDTDGDGLPDAMDINPNNYRNGNGHMANDHDNDGYDDNDRNHDGFDDNDSDRDGYPDMDRTGMMLGEIDQGSILFGTYCASCHQPDGSDLSASTPATVNTGVNSITTMSAVAARLTELDYQCLSAYINQADHAPGWLPENSHGAYADDNGVTICAACHGEQLDGNSNIPSCYTCHDNEWGDGPQAHTAVGNTIPIAHAGLDQSVTTGDTVTLDGSASSDIDNDVLTYQWTMTGIPLGSSVALSNPETANPTFMADIVGTYIIRLVVNDGQTNSVSDTMTVIASDAPVSNVAPIANAGNNQRVTTGDTVILNSSGSSDANKDPLTYDWTIMSTPGGSAATLSDATAANPSFTADLAGNYNVQLVVNDGTINSTASSVTIMAVAFSPAMNGSTLYSSKCAGCHGNMGNKSAAQINAAIRADRGGMSFLSTTTAAEIDAIATYLGP